MSDHHKYAPSSMDRISRCPGSVYMTEGLPELPSPDAAEGTDLHAGVTGDIEGLSDEDIEITERCRQFVIEQAESAGCPMEDVQWEVRLELHDKDGTLINHGTADVVIPGANALIVIDWKFGYIAVDPVKDNWQIANYCAAAMEKYNRESAIGMVYQPRIFKREDRYSEYLYTDPDTIVKNIEFFITRAENKGQIHLVASEPACRYCKARATCPAANRKFMGAVAIAERPGGLAKIAASNARDFWESCGMVDKILKDMRARVRQVLDEAERDGMEVDGLEWSTRRGNRYATDPQAMYDKIAGMIPIGEFMDYVKVDLGKLEDAYARKLRDEDAVDSIKAGKAKFNEVVADCIARGRDSKSVTKRKAGL